MGEIAESGKAFLWMPNQLPMFLQSSDAIQYSLDASKVLRRVRSKTMSPYSVRVSRYVPRIFSVGFPSKEVHG